MIYVELDWIAAIFLSHSLVTLLVCEGFLAGHQCVVSQST